MAKRRGVILVAIGIILATGLAWKYSSERREAMDNNLSNSGLRLASSAFVEQQPIPEKYTCRGQNISPPLQIAGAPTGTQSLVLIVHDPDAVNGDFVHWIVWNIPPNTAEFPEGQLPTGAVQGSNGADQVGYMGPCPPTGTGTHRYMFELYALDGRLNLPLSTNRTQLEAALHDHALAHTTLTGLFSAQ